MMLKRLAIIILVLFVLQAVMAIADEPKTGANQPKPAAASAPTPSDKCKPSSVKKRKKAKDASIPNPAEKNKSVPVSSESKVTGARRVLSEVKGGSAESAGLGDTIRVKVDNLKSFLDKAKTDDKKIHLFMGGQEIKGITPDEEIYGDKEDELQFRLLRREVLPEYANDPKQKAVWAALFGFQDNVDWIHQVAVSVGEEGERPLSSKAQLKLIRIRPYWAFLYILVIAALAWSYKWAYKKGAFLDRGALEDDQTSLKDSKKRALSLARVQMGWWFFLVVAAFFFIWVVIGELPAIPPSILGLIGIASGTALGAAAIDASKRAKANADLQDWETQKALLATQMEALVKKIELKEQQRVALHTKITELKKTPPQDPTVSENKNQELLVLDKEIEAHTAERQDMKVRLDKLASDIKNAQYKKQAVTATGSRIYDMLSDADGVSFHRLQMAIWTVVLGIVFVEQVMSTLALPAFDSTLLALMGFSSGTYLGFKLPEQQPKTQASQ